MKRTFPLGCMWTANGWLNCSGATPRLPTQLVIFLSTMFSLMMPYDLELAKRTCMSSCVVAMQSASNLSLPQDLKLIWLITFSRLFKMYILSLTAVRTAFLPTETLWHCIWMAQDSRLHMCISMPHVYRYWKGTAWNFNILKHRFEFTHRVHRWCCMVNVTEYWPG